MHDFSRYLLNTTRMADNSSFEILDDEMIIKESNTSKILTNLLVIPFGIPICLENLLAIVVLLRSSRLIYQVRILSINLAFTDFLAGLILSIPDDVFGSCLLKKYFTAPFINVSLITVTLFNIDRCCSLKFALRYYELVTPKFLKVACSVSWFFGILISYFMFYDPSHVFGVYCGVMYMAPNNSFSLITRVLQLLTILSNLFMYIYMLKLLYERSSAVSGVHCNDKSKTKTPEAHHQPTNHKLSAKYQIRVVKKLAVITGFFLLCCTPYFLVKAIPNIDYTDRKMRALTAVTAGIMFLNSAINPVLYVWRFTESRYQLKKILFIWNSEKLRKLEIERKSFFASYQINYNTSSEL